MIFAAAVLTAILSMLLANAIFNARSFPRLGRQPDDRLPRVTPYASLLVPARNEGARIDLTVTHLLGQSYPMFDVHVLDDCSEDNTRSQALAAAGDATNFRMHQGVPIPGGWLGKNWACAQLAGHAVGELLVFTDADVDWRPSALAAVMAEMDRSGADLLTVWPTQVTCTWGERLTVPLMAFAVLGYLPIRLAHDFYHPLAAAANGQCMAFRRHAYAAVGGHGAVRNQIVEDVQLARQIKAHGLRLRMADGNCLIACRMYHGLHETIDGYTKNILAGHANSIPLLLLSTVVHLTLFLGPWLWLLAGHSWTIPGWPLWPLLLIVLGIAARAVTAHATHQRPQDALFMPLSALLMSWIALRAIWKHLRCGTVVWKGRAIRHGA